MIRGRSIKYKSFGIRHIFLIVTLLCLSMAIVDGEAPYGVWTFFAVALLFAIVFAVYPFRRFPVWGGMLGAVIGWSTAMAVGVIEHVTGYWSYEGPAPYFEDGVVWGVFVLPLYAWALFAAPCAVGGAIVGGGVGIVCQLVFKKDDLKR